MPFAISAFYDLPTGDIREVYLNKDGKRAFYDTFEEACEVAERMLELLPKARSVEAYLYGRGEPRRVFTHGPLF